MPPKTSRNVACLLALSVGLALAGSGIGAASATTGGSTSDPAALAVLYRAQNIARSTSALARMSIATPESVAPNAARDRGDGTPTMIALAHALPRLNPSDQAAARAVLDPSSSGGGCDGDTGNAYYTRTTDHFAITYTLTGTNGVSNAIDPNTNDNAYVEKVADVLENHVYAHEITTMGFQPPQAPGGGAQIPINLCNIGTGYYGYCAPVSPISGGPGGTAACTLRNNYDGYVTAYDDGDADAPLEVTAAHEYFHAVQFRQNAFANTSTPPLWLMEGTAVWMESQVYPGIRDYLQYLPATGIKNPSVPFNISVTGDDFANNPGALWPFTVYANFAFFKFLSGWLKDNGAVKQIWNYLGNHPNASPMTALNAVLAAHRRFQLGMLLNWSIWNTLPPGSYPERARYAPVGWWQIRKLDRSKRAYTSTIAKIRSFADLPIRINRGTNVRPGTRLRVVVKGPSYLAGGYYTYRISKADGTQVTVTRQIGLHGSAFIIPFNRTVSFVAFTLNNTNASRAQSFRISASVI